MNDVLKQPVLERVYPGLCLRGGDIDICLGIVLGVRIGVYSSTRVA
jgi:hypothetical protein